MTTDTRLASQTGLRHSMTSEMTTDTRLASQTGLRHSMTSEMTTDTRRQGLSASFDPAVKDDDWRDSRSSRCFSLLACWDQTNDQMQAWAPQGEEFEDFLDDLASGRYDKRA